MSRIVTKNVINYTTHNSLYGSYITSSMYIRLELERDLTLKEIEMLVEGYIRIKKKISDVIGYITNFYS